MHVHPAAGAWAPALTPVGVYQQEGPAFRCATSEVTVQPSPCLSYRIPRDFVDLSAGEDAYKLIDFLKLVIFLLLEPPGSLS